jgi:hypothetical protein
MTGNVRQVRTVSTSPPKDQGRINIKLHLSLTQSVGAATTEYHRQCGLEIISVLLTVLEVWKSKIKVPTDSMSSEGPLPSS